MNDKNRLLYREAPAGWNPSGAFLQFMLLFAYCRAFARMLEELLDLVDAGQIEQAENRLYDLTEQERRVDLEMAVLFYSYLNDKSDEFLEAHHFGREEVRLGLEDFARRFGLGGMAEIFLHGGSTEN